MKFKLTIPQIEMEFEAESLDNAYDLVDDGTIDVIGEMHDKRKVEQIEE